jgi:hypothetical protein
MFGIHNQLEFPFTHPTLVFLVLGINVAGNTANAMLSHSAKVLAIFDRLLKRLYVLPEFGSSSGPGGIPGAKTSQMSILPLLPAQCK